MKSSFFLFELIITLILSTTIIIYSSLFLKESYLQNQKSIELELSKIRLISTKIFLEKNKKDLNQIHLANNLLYFKNSLLLKNVEKFDLAISNNIATINIALENSFKQVWKIAL